jgi:hypothetical protein
MTDDANAGREGDAAMGQDELSASLGRGTGPGEDAGTGGVGAGGDLGAYAGGPRSEAGSAGAGDSLGDDGGDLGTSEEV